MKNNNIQNNLLELNITLPEPVKAVAAYQPYIKTNSQVFVSGQLPLKDGKLAAQGILGKDVDITEGQLAAKWSAINVLGQLQDALGDLERIKQLSKITIFVASDASFTEQHIVANGASELFNAVLGEKGEHARSAIGMASLPLNAPVEIEAIVEYE